MPDRVYLKQLQSLPLEAKVILTKQRIKEWYEHFNGNVYVSFSGGKDSTVLAHLVHEMYPEVPLVYSDTGLEYPEVRQFAVKMGATVVRPQMSFPEVITKYGYPIISKEVAEAIHYARRIRNTTEPRERERERENLASQEGRTEGREERPGSRTVWRRRNLTGVAGSKGNETKSMFNKQKWLPLCQETDFKISHYCCNVIKKSPLAKYQHKAKVVPYLGTQASESMMRTQAWVRHGCNAFDGLKQTSQPMSFWTEQDVLKYIFENDIEIASVYGGIIALDHYGFPYVPMKGCGNHLMCSGCQRTGCVYCGFGFHLEKGKTRFQRLAETHPKQYEYCMKGGQYVDNPDYDPTAPKYDGEWLNWNPKKIWIPSKEGLGMKHVFDECNAIYGKDFMRYE